ncbi:nuclease Le1 [Infundibulicybe gibba]|nr:nuclease Le1 [Infundibulicybe gibba]
MYNESLGPAATWADEVRSTPAFAWSAPLHFVDAEDDPPTSCSVFENRDCGNGQCVLTAIANYTTRVVDRRLDHEQRQEALKFLDHFIGDIGQPLHAEALALGGNEISVTCNNSVTNLHSVWDSALINKLIAEKFKNSVDVWVSSLVFRIKAGSFKHLTRSWLSCTSTTKPVIGNLKRSIEDDIAGHLQPHGVIPLQCPLVWARESNGFDCSFVFNFKNGTDLCNSNYFDHAVPIIENQIAKQAFRLAAWLNVLFDGSTKLS